MVRMAQTIRRKGGTIGLVPTMGALHEGHCSLIRAAARQAHVVVVSLFVNPLQFGPREDYARYPRDLPRDVKLAKAAGADVVFAPPTSEMYPQGFSTSVQVRGLSDILEGRSRPGHFRGVATVVLKLLHLVQPTVAYVGQKDYQQAILIQRLVKDLAVPTTIRLLPTVRELDGLAMSSRNRYLTPPERRQATVLCRALREAARRIRGGERHATVLTGAMRRLIADAPLARIDYVAVVDAATLAPMSRLSGRVAILAAVWVGRTRLIDNLLVDVS